MHRTTLALAALALVLSSVLADAEDTISVIKDGKTTSIPANRVDMLPPPPAGSSMRHAAVRYGSAGANVQQAKNGDLYCMGNIQGPVILRSTDAGNSWSSTDVDIRSWGSLIAFKILHDDSFLIVFEPVALAHRSVMTASSTDYGKTWKVRSMDLGLGQSMYVSGKDGNMVELPDGALLVPLQLWGEGQPKSEKKQKQEPVTITGNWSIEFRVKAIAVGETNWGCEWLTLFDSPHGQLGLHTADFAGTRKVTLGGAGWGQEYELDTSKWHAYRITREDGKTQANLYKLYVDSNRRPVISSEQPDVAHKDINGVNITDYNAQSKFQLDYIRWTNAGAFAPVANQKTAAGNSSTWEGGYEADVLPHGNTPGFAAIGYAGAATSVSDGILTWDSLTRPATDTPAAAWKTTSTFLGKEMSKGGGAATSQDRGKVSYVFRSTDGGNPWSKAGVISRSARHVRLVRLSSGKLLASVYKPGVNQLFIVESDDDGGTWTNERALAIDNPGPGDLTLLKDGTVVLQYLYLYNPSAEHTTAGVRAVVSYDQGKTWEKGVYTISHWGKGGYGAYLPGSVALSDGGMLTACVTLDHGGLRLQSITWRPKER